MSSTANVLAFGKTKRILTTADPNVGIVHSLDWLTAGDGARREELLGKGVLATTTTCDVFELLRRNGIPTAYVGRDEANTFLARICDMIPVEVVVRRVATGSYLKRHPDVVEGADLSPPVVEFFYKTTEQTFVGGKLPCDDPLMLLDDQPRGDAAWRLYNPKDRAGSPSIGALLHLTTRESRKLAATLAEAKAIALRVNDVLAAEWKSLDGQLWDFKIEFGTLPDGTLVVADVVDCDSWRVMRRGQQLSKQTFRDGADLNEVLATYRLVAELTRAFADPRPA